MADGLRAVAALPDPVGEVVEAGCAPTACGSSGCGCRSGWSASSTRTGPTSRATPPGCASSPATPPSSGAPRRPSSPTRPIVSCLRAGLAKAGLPEDAVGLVADTSREAAVEFMRLRGVIDCLIPRGGPSLIATLLEHATVPYVLDGDGNCHVYVDAAADLDVAVAIVVNAKTQRPGVCNAAESLLVHRDVAAAFLPRVAARPRRGRAGRRRCDPTVLAGVGARPPTRTTPPSSWTWLSVAVVDDLDAAIDHIARFGSGTPRRSSPTTSRAADRFTSRGRRRGGAGERLDPLRRRRRARPGRRDRHLHAEAPRPGPDGRCGSSRASSRSSTERARYAR